MAMPMRARPENAGHCNPPRCPWLTRLFHRSALGLLPGPLEAPIRGPRLGPEPGQRVRCDLGRRSPAFAAVGLGSRPVPGQAGSAADVRRLLVAGSAHARISLFLLLPSSPARPHPDEPRQPGLGQFLVQGGTGLAGKGGYPATATNRPRPTIAPQIASPSRAARNPEWRWRPMQ